MLSHWPHVAEQVAQQVQQLVVRLVEQHLASVKALLVVGNNAGTRGVIVTNERAASYLRFQAEK